MGYRPLTIREVKLNITSSLVVENTSQFFHWITACVEHLGIRNTLRNTAEKQQIWNRVENRQLPPQVIQNFIGKRILGMKQILIILLVDYLYFTVDFWYSGSLIDPVLIIFSFPSTNKVCCTKVLENYCCEMTHQFESINISFFFFSKIEEAKGVINLFNLIYLISHF